MGAAHGRGGGGGQGPSGPAPAPPGGAALAVGPSGRVLHTPLYRLTGVPCHSSPGPAVSEGANPGKLDIPAGS